MLSIGVLPQEVLYLIFQLFWKEHAQGVSLELKFLVSKCSGVAGIDIHNLSEGAILDADEHDVAGRVRPVLQCHLPLQFILLLDGAVDLVEHMLIVLYALQVVGVAGGDSLAVRYSANLSIVNANLFSDPDSGECDFVKFLEVWMVIVEQ